MRYRIKEYEVGVSSSALVLYIKIPSSIYESLTDDGTGQLDTASTRFVTESIRLISDESQAGYVVMSTGQKGVINQIVKWETDVLGLSFLKSALETAADGDEDDLAAIAAMTASDQFTIEFDWGVESADLLVDYFDLVEAGSETLMTQTEIEDATDEAWDAVFS